jgi:hypothetical protein
VEIIRNTSKKNESSSNTTGLILPFEADGIVYLTNQPTPQWRNGRCR